MSEDLLWCTPAGLTFARAMRRPTDNRTFIGYGYRSKTRITIQFRIDTDQPGNLDAVSRLLAGLTQHAVLYRFSIAHNTTRNSITESIGAINEQNFTVLFDNNSGPQKRRDLSQGK